ncbi:hypothetical protein V6N13_038030 [Hibiscus sabdariffa]
MSIIEGHRISDSDPNWDTLKLVLEESIESGLSSLREYVDQRLNVIDQRIDELHAQVYIDVIETDGSIDWGMYGSLVDTSKPKPKAVSKYWNRVVASIDPSSVTPLMKATLAAAIR